MGDNKKDVCHVVGSDDGVGHIFEDCDEAFDELLDIFKRETWWDIGYFLELQFDDLCASFASEVVCGHFLVLGLTLEQT